MATFKEHATPVVEIDELALDKECVRLPSDFLKWAWQSAEARMEVDHAKTELDVIDADLSKQIRENPAKFGLEKITESAINSAILTNKEHQAALEKLQDAKHDYEMTNAVVTALDAKKRSLTLMVDLHGMGYFANVKMSKEGKDAVDKMTMTKTRMKRREDE